MERNILIVTMSVLVEEVYGSSVAVYVELNSFSAKTVEVTI